jgi:hypothetical protein
MAIELVSDAFQGRVGESFTAAPSLGGEPLELVLTECEEKPESGPPDAPRVPFSLIFHAPGPDHLPQQIFEIGHAQLGDFPLFMVPLGPDGEAMRYQAVIN